MNLNIPLQELISHLSIPYEVLAGDLETTVKRIGAPLHGQPGDVVFIWSAQVLAKVLAAEVRPAVFVVNTELCDEIPTENCCLVSVANAELAMAQMCQHLQRASYPQDWPSIHPSAVIHQSAQIASDCVVGPGAVVEAGVVIGSGSFIGSRVVIEADCRIGSRCVIEAGAYLGRQTQVGERVRIKPGAVVGSDGFGFVVDDKGRYLQVPHLGRVVLEDDVSLGANCCIDRGKLLDTRIGRGTKIDNQGHIAHNVSIGEDCVLTAHFCVAGSTTIGNRLKASGQTGIHPHLELADDIDLAFRAGVTESLPEKGAYGGLPLAKIPDYLRYSSTMKQLPELRKELRSLKKQIRDLTSSRH